MENLPSSTPTIETLSIAGSLVARSFRREDSKDRRARTAMSGTAITPFRPATALMLAVVGPILVRNAAREWQPETSVAVARARREARDPWGRDWLPELVERAPPPGSPLSASWISPTSCVYSAGRNGVDEGLLGDDVDAKVPSSFTAMGALLEHVPRFLALLLIVSMAPRRWGATRGSHVGVSLMQGSCVGLGGCWILRSDLWVIEELTAISMPVVSPRVAVFLTLAATGASVSLALRAMLESTAADEALDSAMSRKLAGAVGGAAPRDVPEVGQRAEDPATVRLEPAHGQGHDPRLELAHLLRRRAQCRP